MDQPNPSSQPTQSSVETDKEALDVETGTSDPEGEDPDAEYASTSESSATNEVDIPATNKVDEVHQPGDDPHAETPYNLRTPFGKLQVDFRLQQGELETLREMYSSLLSTSNHRIQVMNRQIENLENSNNDLRAEVQSNREAANSRDLSPAQVKSSNTFKTLRHDLKQEFATRLREGTSRAIEATQEKASKQLAKMQEKLSETVKQARQSARELNKELSKQKRNNITLEKTLKAAEQSALKEREKLSRTRVDLVSSIRDKKAAEAFTRTVSKTLASCEKEKMELKKELEKAHNCREAKKAEAEVAALKRDEIALEKKKLECETRLHSKVLVAELDKKKREHLIMTQAQIKEKQQVNKEIRTQQRSDTRRQKRDEEATSRLCASLAGVCCLNLAQNAGEWPPLRSPEALAFTNERTAAAAAARCQHAPPVPQDIATIVANVMAAMRSRGEAYTDDPLPEGVQMERDLDTGEVIYRLPPDEDGHREVVTNRDDIYRKRPASTADHVSRSVRHRVVPPTPPSPPPQTVAAVVPPPAAAQAEGNAGRLQEEAFVAEQVAYDLDGDSRPRVAFTHAQVRRSIANLDGPLPEAFARGGGTPGTPQQTNHSRKRARRVTPPGDNRESNHQPGQENV